MRSPLRSPFLLLTLGAGFAFLYLPILLLVVYSFNASRLVTVWGGFSIRWYVALFQDTQILSAAKASLIIAATTATFATVIGTMAGLALARFGRFRGRSFFASMMAAPLVMPEVISGLSILLLFVTMEQIFGWPNGRGITTIVIAHITFTSAYVTVVIQSRLAQMDESVEEAALDLGARPLKVFFLITLPIISPALIAGWLLAFTLSFDDLVVASFASGPESTTLPMVVFSSVRMGVSPKINALASLMVLVAVVAILVAAWLMHRTEKARRKNAIQPWKNN